MKQVVHDTFRLTVDVLRSEFAVMPLSRWNESVLRYHFSRCLAISCPEVEQLLECDRIDLVLGRAQERAFIEFKFFTHAPRVNPYDGSKRGYKGGPGRKNLSEFESCVELLSSRRADASLSKYIVLVYADPADGDERRKYSRDYDEYRHPQQGVRLQRVEDSGVIRTSEGTVRAHLYEVSAESGVGIAGRLTSA